MQPVVGIVMGSKSDWETMKCAEDVLVGLGVACEVKVVSAHRTPDLLFEYAETAAGRGLKAIIAGAGGPNGTRTGGITTSGWKPTTSCRS